MPISESIGGFDNIVPLSKSWAEQSSGTSGVCEFLQANFHLAMPNFTRCLLRRAISFDISSLFLVLFFVFSRYSSFLGSEESKFDYE